MIDKNLFKKTENLLRNYNKSIIKIKMIKEDIRIIKTSYVGCGAIGYDEKTGPTNKFNSSVENEIINREKKLNKLKEELEYEERLKNRIDAAIESLQTQEEKDLIKLRYINSPRISWGNVARHLRYNKDYCRKELAPNAIKQITDFIFYNPGIQERINI